ncbi:MAG: hypothetical protein GEV06_16465 [Luteitalea sp.]|nr:hypothetical protein [Luteitalea sp.]
MTSGAAAWLVVFTIAALVFFGIAGWVTVAGLRDLRHLLRRPHRTAIPAPSTPEDGTDSAGSSSLCSSTPRRSRCREGGTRVELRRENGERQ